MSARQHLQRPSPPWAARCVYLLLSCLFVVSFCANGEIYINDDIQFIYVCMIIYRVLKEAKLEMMTMIEFNMEKGNVYMHTCHAEGPNFP